MIKNKNEYMHITEKTRYSTFKKQSDPIMMLVQHLRIEFSLTIQTTIPEILHHTLSNY